MELIYAFLFKYGYILLIFSFWMNAYLAYRKYDRYNTMKLLGKWYDLERRSATEDKAKTLDNYIKKSRKKSKLASLWALIVSGFFAFISIIQILENYLFK